MTGENGDTAAAAARLAAIRSGTEALLDAGAFRAKAEARYRDHAAVDERRRRMCTAVAEHVRRDPSHVTRALARVDARLARADDSTRWSDEQWRRLLLDALASPQGLDAVLAVLEDRTEDAARLRQSAPFVGVLSQDERSSILTDLRYDEAISATTVVLTDAEVASLAAAGDDADAQEDAALRLAQSWTAKPIR